MYFLFMILISVLAFAVQLILCIKTRSRLMKCLPGIAVLIYEMVCWGIYWLARLEILGKIRTIELGFACMVLGFMGLLWMGGIFLGWFLWGTGKWLYRIYRRKIIWRI